MLVVLVCPVKSTTWACIRASAWPRAIADPAIARTTSSTRPGTNRAGRDGPPPAGDASHSKQASASIENSELMTARAGLRSACNAQW